MIFDLKIKLIPDSCFKAFVSEGLPGNREFRFSKVVVYPDFWIPRGINHGRTPCTFCTLLRGWGKYAKSARRKVMISRIDSFCIRGFAQEIEENLGYKGRVPRNSWNSRNSSEKCLIWPCGAAFSRFSGFPGIFRGSEMSNLALQRYFFNFLTFQKSKSVRSTGILEFQLLSKSICNGFGLTALLFQFFTFSKARNFFEKISKTRGLSPADIMQYRVCDRAELMISRPPYLKFSL